MITLTKEASEKVKQVLAERDQDPETTALRVFVREGGCSGFSYGLRFERNPSADDAVIDQHGVKIVIDPTSAMYLRGSKIDYVENLMGGGFTILNPNAQQTCGCGQSFRTANSAGKPEPCSDE